MIGWFAGAIGAGEVKNGVALDYLRYLAGENYREKATEWFEHYYGTEAFEPVGREGLIGQWSEKLAQVLDERDEARRDVARLTSELNLAKNTAPEPVTEDDSGWTMIPLDAAVDPARKIRLTIVGPAGEGWDGSLATDYRWDDDHDVTLEILGGPQTLTGVIHPRDPRRICYNPIGPMELGSMCSDCGHHATAHTDSGNGPCLLCFLEAKFA